MSLFMPSKIQKYSLLPNLGRKSLLKILALILAAGYVGYVAALPGTGSQMALVAAAAVGALAGILSYFYYLRAPGGLSVSEYLSLMTKFLKGQRRFFYRKS